MIDKQGIVKIIDFGSVKIAGIAEITPLDYDSEENILGTLNYTAPEYHLDNGALPNPTCFHWPLLPMKWLTAPPFWWGYAWKANAINLAKLQYVPSFHNNTMVPIWIDGALKKAHQ